MAAREDQAQPFVGNRLVLLVGLDGLERGQQLGLAPERLLAANPVDRPVARGRQQPGAGVGGGAFARPPLDRGGEGLLHRVLGELDVAERAGQDREGAPPLLPEDFLYQGVACDADREAAAALPRRPSNPLSWAQSERRLLFALAVMSRPPRRPSRA